MALLFGATVLIAGGFVFIDGLVVYGLFRLITRVARI